MANDRSLVVKISANMEAMKRELAKADAVLATTSSAMRKMSDSYDGAKTIANANAAMLQIQKLGGTTGLTEREQRKLNSELAEGVAKYQALGRVAPPEMIALEQATRKVEVAIAKVNNELAKQPESIDKVSSRAVAIGSAFGSFVGNMAWSAVNKLGDELATFATRGAQLPALQSSFGKLASGVGSSSSAMLASMQKASRGMVSEFDLMTAANKAMLLGLPVTAESLGTLTEAATTLGRAMGLTATKSVDDLITALGRSSPMILDNLGLSVKVAEANENYAKKLNIVGRELTDAEKKMAFYEEAMRKAKDKTEELGKETLTLSDYLGILWTNVGNKVTNGAAAVNVGAGQIISGAGKAAGAWDFFSNTFSKGALGSAFSLGSMGRSASQVGQIMSGAQAQAKPLIDRMAELRKEAEGLLSKIAPVPAAMRELVVMFDKGGMSAKDIAAKIGSTEDAVKNYLSAVGRASAESTRFSEAVQEQRDRIQGVIAPSKEWVRALTDLGFAIMSLPGGPGKPSALDKIPQTTNWLRDMRATLPGVTANMWAFHESMKPRADEDPFAWMKQRQFLPLNQIKTEIDLATGKLISGGEAAGKAFREGFAGAISNIGRNIVSAIQGGGNVLKSIFGSVALDLGDHFSKKFAESASKGMSANMTAAVGGVYSAVAAYIAWLVPQMVEASRSVVRALSTTEERFKALEERFKSLGAVGAQAMAALQKAIVAAFGGGSGAVPRGDMEALIGIFEEFKTKLELDKIASQWKAAYDSMLASGLYTAATLEEVWKRYQDAMKAAEGAVDGRPEGARGFPTRAQLEKAAKDAEAAFIYMRDSGLYTAETLEQAWQQWQDALVAGGDKGIKALRDLDAEIKGLQDSIANEAPEEVMGVIEAQTRAKIEALEAEKKKALDGIDAKVSAEESAAQTAQRAAEDAYARAIRGGQELDTYLRELFAKGYTIPINFGGGMPAMPAYAGAFANGGVVEANRPTFALFGEAGPERATFTPMGRSGGGGGGTSVVVNINHPTVRKDSDIKDMTREICREMPRHLKLIGAQ